MSWTRDGYVIKKSFIAPQLVKVLAQEFKLARDIQYRQFGINLKKKTTFGDSLVKNSFAWYSPMSLESLQASVVLDLVTKTTQAKVWPTYSYGRIYFKNAELLPHFDRPACEISVTCCLSSQNPKWPIGLKDRQGKTVRIYQSPGDVLIYAGRELLHWREKYQGDEHIQCFLHFVRQSKKNLKLKWDGRALPGLPVDALREP